MRWQGSMSQTKEQDKTPKEQLSEVEVGNLLKKEFRVMTVNMIQDLGKRTETQTKKILNKKLIKSRRSEEQR